MNHQVRPSACDADHRRRSLLRLENGGSILQWGFIIVAVGMLYYYTQSTGPARETLADMFTIFLSIVLEALPFMLLGSLAGGFIEVFVPQEKLSSILSDRKVSAVLVAAGMGLIFPVCECAIIPVVRRLLGKGISFSSAVAYLLAGPLVNPIVAASTAVANHGVAITIWPSSNGRLESAACHG